MIITPLTFDVLKISLSPEKDKIRSPGVHLTHITKDMLLSSGISRKGKGKPMSEGEQHLTFEKGFLWERIAEQAIKCQLENDIEGGSGFLVRPGECEKDGIFLTPDAINLKSWHLEEWKSTGMRSAGFSIPDRRPEWLWQAMAYCGVFGMNRVIFRIWHHSEMPPNVTAFQIDFETAEVDINWRRILDHWAYMQRRDAAA